MQRAGDYVEPSGNNGLTADKDDEAVTGTEVILQYDFQGHSVRSVVRDGSTWFVAADVCAALNMKNTSDSLGRLDADEKGVALTDTLGGVQESALVSESGLYALTLSSRKPQARAFRR